jgi:hypothetical protein
MTESKVGQREAHVPDPECAQVLERGGAWIGSSWLVKCR